MYCRVGHNTLSRIRAFAFLFFCKGGYLILFLVCVCMRVRCANSCSVYHGVYLLVHFFGALRLSAHFTMYASVHVRTHDTTARYAVVSNRPLSLVPRFFLAFSLLFARCYTTHTKLSFLLHVQPSRHQSTYKGLANCNNGEPKWLKVSPRAASSSGGK